MLNKQIDSFGVWVSTRLSSARFFSKSLESPSFRDHLTAIHLSIPDIKGPGDYEVQAQTHVGVLSGGIRVVQWKGARPTIIYHHGTSEKPFDASFRRAFPANALPDANLIVIRAPYHEGKSPSPYPLPSRERGEKEGRADTGNSPAPSLPPRGGETSAESGKGGGTTLGKSPSPYPLPSRERGEKGGRADTGNSPAPSLHPRGGETSMESGKREGLRPPSFPEETQYLDRYVAMMAVSVQLVEHVVKLARFAGSQRILAAGVSLGGAVTNRHHVHFNTATIYCPMFASPLMGDVFLEGAYAQKVSMKARREPDYIQRTFNMAHDWAQVTDSNVYPLLGRYDAIIPFAHHRASYGKRPVVVANKGHVTGILSGRLIREHIMKHLGTPAVTPKANVQERV